MRSGDILQYTTHYIRSGSPCLLNTPPFREDAEDVTKPSEETPLLGEAFAEYDKAWNDPIHWKLGLFYYCPEDKRPFVPRRPMLGRRPYGVTLNFAQPRARRVLFLGIGVCLLAMGLAALSR